MKLSVIVVAFHPADIRAQCLRSLEQQTLRDGVEILVMNSQPGDSVPILRSRGLAQSRGEIVALLEDDCVAPPTWCADLIAAHAHPADAIGGAVDAGDYRRAADWAAYFCEYGRFMPPLPADETALPGTNVSYKRAALPATPEGFYEAFVHQSLRLKADPRLVVRNINSEPFAQVLRRRYHHGRGYAAMRVAGKPRWQRLGYAIIPVVLPALQLWRIMRVAAARQRLGRVVAVLPWLTACYVSWSWGEWMGYLFGPGQSLEYWA